MSLFEAVQTRRAELRKDATQVTGFKILTLLVGELETLTKGKGLEITDEKVVAVIKKLIKSNDETIKLCDGDARLTAENQELQTFLPSEMSEDALRDALRLSGATSIGDAMKYLGQHFAGQYDKGTASRVAKELVS